MIVCSLLDIACLLFKTKPHVSQTSLKITMKPKMTLDFISFLCIPNDKVIL